MEIYQSLPFYICILFHIKNSKLDNKILYFQIISLINESINILNTALIPQPKETLTALWYSNEKFSIGSQKLLSAELYPQVDGRHMNKDFGILWLTNFMNEIDSTAEQLS
jgi:hypothetical protein